MLMVLVMTPHLRIRQKSKKWKDISRFEWGKFAEIERRSYWFFCLRHRGFDRVLAGCRARDRTGPKGGGTSMMRDSVLFLYIFHFFSLTAWISLFKCTAQKDTQKSELIFQCIWYR